MEKILAILALLSTGIGLGIIIFTAWEIIKKIPALKRTSVPTIDLIIAVALISAVISRLLLKINGSIKCNLLVATGSIIGTILFYLIINHKKTPNQTKTGP